MKTQTVVSRQCSCFLVAVDFKLAVVKRWSQRELKLLGKMPDRLVAEKIGRSIWCVMVQRRKHSIPRYVGRNEYRSWTRTEESLLGTKPDAELAQQLNCGVHAVCH